VNPNLFRQGVTASLGDMSSDAAQHAADVIFLAYQVALSQNDRVTDQDFRTALDQIAKGREPETFIPNMLNRVDDQIRSHDAMVKSALGATEIRLFIDQYGDFPGFSLDELQPFSDFAVSAGFEAEIQRFNELDAKYRGGGSTNTSPPAEETTDQTDAQTDSTFMLITPEVVARSPRLAPYAGKSIRAVQQPDGSYIIEVEGEKLMETFTEEELRALGLLPAVQDEDNAVSNFSAEDIQNLGIPMVNTSEADRSLLPLPLPVSNLLRTLL
jgi:hypothetical protein